MTQQPRGTTIKIEKAARQLGISTDELLLMIDDLEATFITLDKFEWLSAEIAKRQNTNLVVSDKNVLPVEEKEHITNSITEYVEYIDIPRIDVVVLDAFLNRCRELDAANVAREHADAIFTEKELTKLSKKNQVLDESVERAEALIGGMKKETESIHERLKKMRGDQTTKTSTQFDSIVQHLPTRTQELLRECYTPREA